MKNIVNIAIIGAGSAQFSSGIVRDLCLQPALHGSNVCFMDIDEEKLSYILRLGKRIAEEYGTPLNFRATTQRENALRGADFVINIALVGGHAFSEWQRSLAEKYGYYRGCYLHFFPSIAFMVDLARDMERYCPDAWLIESANPVFEGCTMINRLTKIKTIGLCHGHLGCEEAARIMGLDLERCSFTATGFNHWIWMNEFLYDGKDAYPLLDQWIEEKGEAYWAENHRFNEHQLSRAAIDSYRLFGLLPIGDTSRMNDYPRLIGWRYNNTLELKKYWYGPGGGFDSEQGWQQYLDELEENLAKVRRAVEDTACSIKHYFPPVASKEQIVPIIHSIKNDVPGLYQINVPNTGHAVPGIPENIVVECKAMIDGKGVHTIQSKPLPPRIQAFAMNVRYAEAEMTCEVYRSGSREALKLFLLMDHRTKNDKQVDDLIDEWLTHPLTSYYQERMKK